MLRTSLITQQFALVPILLDVDHRLDAVDFIKQREKPRLLLSRHHPEGQPRPGQVHDGLQQAAPLGEVLRVSEGLERADDFEDEGGFEFAALVEEAEFLRRVLQEVATHHGEVLYEGVHVGFELGG